MQKEATRTPSRQALADAIEALRQHEASERGLQQRHQQLEQAVFQAQRELDAAQGALQAFGETLSEHYRAEAQGTPTEKPRSRRQLEDLIEEAELRLQVCREERHACATVLRETWRGDKLRLDRDRAVSAVLGNDGRDAVLAVGHHVARLQEQLVEWGKALTFLQSKHAFEPNTELGAHHGLPADDDIRRAYNRFFTAPQNWGALISASDASEPWRAAFEADASKPWREGVAALATNPDAPVPDGPARTVALVGKSPRLVGSAA